jgi:hypothetical protein
MHARGFVWCLNKENLVLLAAPACSSLLTFCVLHLSSAMATRSRARFAAQAEDNPEARAPGFPVPIEPGEKRKRSKTLTNSTAPSAKRPAIDQLQMPVSNELEPTMQNPTPKALEKRTRPANNPHPAKSVGLEKRTQVDIHVAAAAKKAIKQGKVDARLQEHTEKTLREERGVKAIAALLNQRKEVEECCNGVDGLNVTLYGATNRLGMSYCDCAAIKDTDKKAAPSLNATDNTQRLDSLDIEEVRDPNERSEVESKERDEEAVDPIYEAQQRVNAPMPLALSLPKVVVSTQNYIVACALTHWIFSSQKPAQKKRECNVRMHCGLISRMHVAW